MISVVEALHDVHLFGALFKDPGTWASWRVFLAAIYGLALDAAGRALFKKHTAREYEPPPGGWQEVVCVVGRQSGKSQVAGVLAAFEAIRQEPTSAERYALLVAQDERAARRTLFSYAREALEASELVRSSVSDVLADTLVLRNGTRVAAYPCRPSSVRGLRAVVAVADELAFFRGSQYEPMDREMLRALRPCLATTGGRLVMLSSPYGEAGELWSLHRRHYGRTDSHVLVWQASAPEMNPTLPPDYLARMREEDPEAYRSEVLGEFRSGLTTLIAPEVIERAVVSGRRELPPANGVTYRAFTDPSGGRADAWTLAIGHRDGERAVVDCLRAWAAPFNPSGVTVEVAQLLRSYGLRRVVGDRFAAEWVAESMRANGIDYQTAVLPKSELYIELLAHLNADRVELLDQAETVRELRMLERHRGPSGRDRVDHPPGRHDDAANAVAGIAHELLGRRRWGFAELYPHDRKTEEVEHGTWQQLL